MCLASILRVLTGIVAYGLAGCACLAQTPSEDIQRAFQKALELQQKGDLESAIAAYEQLLQIRSDVPPAHANLGAALAKLGRYEESIANYNEALKGGENPATRLNLGLAYYKLGDLSHAVTEFEQVRAQQPGNVQANDLAADCYLRMGENQHVIEIARPLAAAHPDDLAVQYILGMALIHDHQKGEGQRVIDRILQHGENAGANLLEAQMAIDSENYAQADACAEKAIHEAPQLADAYLLSGLAKEGFGDHAAARAAFRRSLELDPNGFDANLQLGALLAHDSDLNPARDYVQAAVRLRPHSAAALYEMGLIDKQAGSLEDARKAFEEAEKDAPNWLEPHVQLASLYYRLKLPQEGMRERDAVSRLSVDQNKP